MPKPTFAPQYVPPDFYGLIQDVSQPSAPSNQRVAAFIGQGSKTLNRVDELTKGVKNGTDGPLTNDTVIDVISIVDIDNIKYTKGVDFKISRNVVTGKASIDWSPVASLTGTAALAAGSPDLTTLNGEFLNIAIDNAAPISVQFSGFDNTKAAADVVTFINQWAGANSVASSTAGNLLVLSANSIVINEGSANTILGFITGQFAQVGEPAPGKLYQVFYTSDKLPSEYGPQLMPSISAGVPVYGPAQTPNILIGPNAVGSVATKVLNDPTLTMTPDQYVGNYLKITAGPGKGQVRVIYSNTATQFLLSQDWTAGNLPDSTSTYQVTDINFNSIIMGAKCYVDLNGSFFIGSQTPEDIFDVNNEKAAILALESDVSGVTPCLEVFMRGLGSTDAASVTAFLSAHVNKMSDDLHNKYRGCVVGMAQNYLTFTDYATLASGISNRRLIVMAPPSVSKDFGFGLVTLDGSFFAAGLAGIYCDINVDAGEPIFGKPMGACFDVNSFSDPFTYEEKNFMAAAGVCIVERDGTDIIVRDDLTTDQSTDFSSGIKFLRMSDGIANAVRTQMKQSLKGKRMSKDVVSLADSVLTVVLNGFQVPQVSSDHVQIDHVENQSVVQNATQHQQLDMAANIYLVGDVKWEFAQLGFGI